MLLLSNWRVKVSCVVTCQYVLRALVFNCLACSPVSSPANVPCVPMCSHAVTSDNKKTFSVTYFTYIFGTFSLPFFYDIKLFMIVHEKQERLYKHLHCTIVFTYCTLMHFSYQAEAFNGYYIGLFKYLVLVAHCLAWLLNH